MSSPLIIRHALPTDADRISQLICGVADCCTVTPAGDGAELFFSSISAQAIGGYIANADFLYLLGLFGDELAGVVAVRDARHVFHLFVAPAFQYQGIGTALALRAIELSLAASPSETFTVNSSLPAAPFYERLGFQPQGPGIEDKGVAFVPMQLATSSLSNGIVPMIGISPNTR
jgi:GNAT superfamily N-acetyltransferase